jgi:S-adenosylhomocysteine hydrolase
MRKATVSLATIKPFPSLPHAAWWVDQNGYSLQYLLSYKRNKSYLNIQKFISFQSNIILGQGASRNKR